MQIGSEGGVVKGPTSQSGPYARAIEIISNAVIVLVVLVVGTIFVKNYLINRSNRQFLEPSVGDTLKIPGENFSEHDQTLLIVLKEGCRYCAESAAFYRQIVRGNALVHNLHITVVLPSGDKKEYLDELKLPVSDVKHADLKTIKVGGTPALVLVDKHSTIQKVWMGKLPPSMEDEVKKTLGISCSECS